MEEFLVWTEQWLYNDDNQCPINPHSHLYNVVNLLAFNWRLNCLFFEMDEFLYQKEKGEVTNILQEDGQNCNKTVQPMWFVFKKLVQCT